MEDGRFDLICTVSLLGLRGYNKKVSKGVSTGFEKVITMKPMDFEEYLWAIGLEKNVIDYVKKCFAEKTQVIPNVNEKLMKYFKEYLCVGGLPMVFSMVLQALYNVVDTIFVINMKEEGIKANLALTYFFPVQIFMIAIGVGTGIGINALLSRALGEKDEKRLD